MPAVRGAQELAVCDAQAAKVHASAPANTNVYIGNLPVEVPGLYPTLPWRAPA